jgi:hypothetical protein
MINDLILKCQEAQRAFKEQDKKMRHPTYNGRYWPKAKRLLKEWQKAERAMLKAIYK